MLKYIQGYALAPFTARHPNLIIMLVFIEFEKQPLLFSNPKQVISCYHIQDAAKCFHQLEEAVEKGYYLAGFFSYELGYAFEKSLQYKGQYGFPLICMGVFDAPQYKYPDINVEPNARIAPIEYELNITQKDYFDDIQKIKGHIQAGDVYQITYCIKYKFDYAGQPYQLYRYLFDKQPVPYPAYIQTPQFNILSLSPEMFMKKKDAHIITKPMKGTWIRGNVMEDVFGGLRLHYDKKNRAENLMICDLLRNDLGRVGKNINVPRLFEVDRYKTLYQMTSTVTANIHPDLRLYDLFKALHPSGSVTGAPKIRAMQVIHEIEGEERKIYTGAIGYITPKKDLFFNVPIRTILLEDGSGEMGVGGGIVWDSTPQGEFDECMIKARFIFN